MTDKQINRKYCDGIDCGWCAEKEPCIYKIANRLEEQLQSKEQECEELKKTIDDLLHKPEIQDKILWKIDNEALLGSKDAWIYKLIQTLTEIKEIANYSFDLSTSELLAKLEQILQKCEVIR